jgi:hypothetical protein
VGSKAEEGLDVAVEREHWSSGGTYFLEVETTRTVNALRQVHRENEKTESHRTGCPRRLRTWSRRSLVVMNDG